MTRRILLPPLTEVGAGSLNRLPEILSHLGVQRAFVVVDVGLPAELVDRLTGLASFALAGDVVRGPEGEPTTDAADQYAAMARSVSCDGVVAVGGGSVMDLVKAVSMLVGQPGVASEYQGMDLVSGLGLPVVCVPTTAGSGAEATKSAVLTNQQAQVKRGINATGVLPDAVILDPNLLISLPQQPRIAALLDATAHALESYVGQSSWSISEMCSVAAFPRLGTHLRFDGEVLTVDQAEDALIGSFLAGAAICNSETGAIHALAYPLTEYHGIPHAYAVGALLPEVMMMQEASCTGHLDYAADCMGFESRKALFGRTSDLRDQLGILEQVRNVVADTGALSRVVERAMTLTGALGNSPRAWTETDARHVYVQVAGA